MTKKLSVFEFDDYRSYLKAAIANHGESWGLIAKMAEAAECQRPYLSKVLSQEAQLTPAQGFGLTQFFSLDSEEAQYFLLMLESERAGTKKYRDHIQKKLMDARRDFEVRQKQQGRPALELSEGVVAYYSSWLSSALHILVSIPEFQTLKSISSRFQIPETTAEFYLKKLAQDGLVKESKGKWEYAAGNRHLAKNSPYTTFHHSNWRGRAMIDAQAPHTDGVHFTVVQSLSLRDFAKLKQLVHTFLDDAGKIAAPSREEELICLALDFFKV